MSVLFTGRILSNGILVGTLAGSLLSAVWMQVATFGGYRASDFVIRHLQAAVRRACAGTSRTTTFRQNGGFVSSHTGSHCTEPESLIYPMGCCRPMPTGREGATRPGTSPMLITLATPIGVVHGATMLVVFCTVVDSTCLLSRVSRSALSVCVCPPPPPPPLGSFWMRIVGVGWR